ncbi:MAG: glycoside hydrolase family 26 protein [Melioribacteraceae bacterium]|nr:glycoside hydrolase family 26 protein [Melioribacteraceae bacterium]MCF8265162.1 glycoside hydrolase family 26 protein [Melioribacteraceae bacterium]MCF8413238.1 glycoside hydrolase family 26 protein [Melioribacteraceae bacterium]
MVKSIFLFSLFVLLISGCKKEFDPLTYQNELKLDLVNTNSTKQTINLYYNLESLSKKYILFGHHHTTAYGVFWRGESNRSDVKDVTGSFPAVYGWDFGDVTQMDISRADWMIPKIADAFDNNSVNTFAWHYGNPVTGKSFYDTTKAVANLLPGGTLHQQYKHDLDRIARFAKGLTGKNHKLIPIIFRPFHELDGSWFWWGANFCTPDEIKELFRFTVNYLRDFRKVPNIIYAFSPDRNFENEEEYLERYPGDEFVDMIGVDNYWDFTPNGDGIEAVIKKLQILTTIGKKKNKLTAFTETGLESIPDKQWWTDKLLKVLSAEGVEVAYVLVWRNANQKHHYAPYPGHPSEADFMEFRNSSKILFADDLPNLYESTSNFIKD